MATKLLQETLRLFILSIFTPRPRNSFSRHPEYWFQVFSCLGHQMAPGGRQILSIFSNFRDMATKWLQEAPWILILNIFTPRPTNGPRRLPESTFNNFHEKYVGVKLTMCSFAGFEIIMPYLTNFSENLRKGYIAWIVLGSSLQGARLQLLKSFYRI